MGGVVYEVGPVLFAQRSSTLQTYDQALIDFLESKGCTVTATFDAIGTFDLANFDLLIIGAPGTGYTAHPEASVISAAALPIVSMCRHTSRNALGMGSNSSGFNMDSMNREVDVANDPRATEASVSLPLQSAQGVNASSATIIYSSNDATYPAVAERIETIGGEDYSRLHWAYYEFPDATQQAEDLFWSFVTTESAVVTGNAVTLDGTPAEAVRFFTWPDGPLVAVVTPDAQGDWEAVLVFGTYGVTYIADGYAGQTHGPYELIPEPPP